MSYIQNQGSKFISCPFDNSHKVLEKKIISHISKCSAYRVKHQDFQMCKYNYLHIIKNSEIQSHEQNCPDQPNLQQIEEPQQAIIDQAFSNWFNNQNSQSLEKNSNQIKSDFCETQNLSKKRSKDKMKKLRLNKDNENNVLKIQQELILNEYQKNLIHLPKQQQNEANRNSLILYQNEDEEELKVQGEDLKNENDFYSIFIPQQNSYLKVEKSADACFQLQHSVLYLEKNKFTQSSLTDQEFQQKMSSEILQNQPIDLEQQSLNQNRKYIRKFQQAHNIPDYQKEDYEMIGSQNILIGQSFLNEPQKRGNRILQNNNYQEELQQKRQSRIQNDQFINSPPQQQRGNRIITQVNNQSEQEVQQQKVDSRNNRRTKRKQ